MRKITLLSLLLTTLWSYSQVKNYTCVYPTPLGSYTEITGGTALDLTDVSSGTVLFTDPAFLKGNSVAKAGFPIGFAFAYDGVEYDKFMISGNGWIALGTTALGVNGGPALANPLSVASSAVPEILNARISALGTFLKPQAGATLSFTTSGVEGSKVLTVQWKGYKKSTTGIESFNFQIKLYQGTNAVELAYGPITYNGSASTAEVGLRAGTVASAAGNFYTLTTAAGGWTSPVKGLYNGNIALNNSTGKPAIGSIFRFSPPACAEPKQLVSYTTTNNSATFTWGAPVPAPATGYQYILSTSSTAPADTVSGTDKTTTTVIENGLTANTIYYVFVRSACGSGFSTWTNVGSFKTKCDDKTAFSENFDSYTGSATTPTTPVLPDCWDSKLTGAGSRAYIYTPCYPTPCSPAVNRLFMEAYTSATTYAIMPTLSNLSANTHRLKFKAYSNDKNNPGASKTLTVGYFDDTDTFVALQPFTLTTTQAEHYYKPTGIPAYVKSLVFRNAEQGTVSGTNDIYIDDVVWEVSPPCTDLKNVGVKLNANNSVQLSWETYGTETANAWQYVYTDPAVTYPTTETLHNANAMSVTINDLQPSTSYRIWVRSNCQAQYGVWYPSAVFSTPCLSVATVYQDFDANTIMPDCWKKLSSNGTLAVAPSVGTGFSNALLLTATDSNSNFVAFPPLSTAKDGGYRLRFKYKISNATSTMEVICYKDAINLNGAASYTVLKTITNAAAGTPIDFDESFSATETPNLGIRFLNSSAKTLTIDDFVWEPVATCPDVTAFAVKGTKNNSVSLRWTKTTESGWQYAFGNPTNENAKEFTSAPSVSNLTVDGAISGLTSNTPYKVWVRSKCDSSFGSWIGPLYFSTTCDPVELISENFDASTVVPACWNKVGTTGGALTVTAPAGVAPVSNALTIIGNTNSKAIVALPPVSNSAAGSHQLKVRLSGTVLNAQLEVGYLMINGDPTSFNSLNKFLNVDSNTAYNTKIVELGTLPGSQVLAFRYAGTTTSNSSVYIDELSWEPLPTCSNISAVKPTEITSTTIGLTWKRGEYEAEWQYAFGDSDATLVAKDFDVAPTENGPDASVTIDKLTPATDYKIWVRSKCTSTIVGTWYGPYFFRTACESVSTFTEKFDASTNLPACWVKSGDQGTVAVGTTTVATNATNVLKLTSNATEKPVVVMQPVNTNGLGSYRLRFKFSSNVAGAGIEVGYVTNIADPTTFNLQESFSATAKDAFYTKTISGDKFATQFLAFRTANASSVISIDDVYWETIPACPDVDAATLAVVKSTSVKLNWKVSANETAWQYVAGDPTQNNPDALTGVDFISPVVTDQDVTGTAINLLPSTSYKLWIRSKCGDGPSATFGPWSNPTLFVTPCPAVETFTQNFDSGNFDSCWKSMIGDARIVDKTGEKTDSASGEYMLRLYTDYGANKLSMASMAPVSNIAAGTNRLRFKFKSTNPSAVLEVGYLTNPSIGTTFVPVATFAPSSSYTEGMVVFENDKIPTSEVLAFRSQNPASGVVSLYIDDVIWEKKSTCPEIKNLEATTSGSNTAGFKWVAGGNETAWQYAKGNASDTDPNSLTAVDVLPAATEVSLNGLASFTTYNIWVRSKCDQFTVGDWVGPIAIATTCDPTTAILEDFESTSANTNSLPSCWKKVGNQGSAYVGSAANGSAPSGVKVIFMKTPIVGQKVIVALPAISNLNAGTHFVRFKSKSSGAGATLELGYLTNISDGESFVSIKTYTPTTTYKTEMFTLGSTLPASAVLAFRKAGLTQSWTNGGMVPVLDSHGDPVYDQDNKPVMKYMPPALKWEDAEHTIPTMEDNPVYMDDVSWEEKKIPACTTATAVTDANCGNFSNTISWSEVDNASGYKLNIGTATGLTDVLYNEDLGTDLSYTFTGKAGQTYFYTVKPYNATGTAAACSEMSFTTNAKSCYCTSVPVAKYGTGITKVKINATDIAVPDATYSDLTAQPVKLAKGLAANIQVTANTLTYKYHTYVWIDFNDNYVFEGNEQLFSANTAPTEPSILDASFTIPNEIVKDEPIKLGIHRMRIVSTLGEHVFVLPGNACFNGDNGITVDLAVDLFTAAENDSNFNPTLLTVGTVFADHAITGSNVGATATAHDLQPGCGNYVGSDVWYQAIVPATGKLTFEVNSVSGGLTNMAMAAYVYNYGTTVPTLVLLACDDSSSQTEGDQPKITLTDQEPSTSILIRVWNNGSTDTGLFKVSAYGAQNLAVDTFTAGNLSYYPNPVKDIFNISLDQEISDVVVMNMLGQQVISQSVKANNAHIDMSGLSKGTYLVKISAGNQSKTVKAIVE